MDVSCNKKTSWHEATSPFPRFNSCNIRISLLWRSDIIMCVAINQVRVESCKVQPTSRLEKNIRALQKQIQVQYDKGPGSSNFSVSFGYVCNVYNVCIICSFFLFPIKYKDLSKKELLCQHEFKLDPPHYYFKWSHYGTFIESHRGEK